MMRAVILGSSEAREGCEGEGVLGGTGDGIVDATEVADVGLDLGGEEEQFRETRSMATAPPRD